MLCEPGGRVFLATVSVGDVIRQDPGPGLQDNGATVTLYISTRFTLEVEFDAVNSPRFGIVFSTPPGISCPGNLCGPMSFDVFEVTLKAEAGWNVEFTGGCDQNFGPTCTVTMDRNRFVTFIGKASP